MSLHLQDNITPHVSHQTNSKQPQDPFVVVFIKPKAATNLITSLSRAYTRLESHSFKIQMTADERKATKERRKKDSILLSEICGKTR